MQDTFGLLQLLIGAYLLYNGIAGKGKLYENDNIKKGMEEAYHSMLRRFALVLGPVMLLQAGLDIWYDSAGIAALRIVSIVLFGILVLGMGYLFYKVLQMTDRKKTAPAGKAKGKDKQQAPAPTAPRAAFYFEDEDEKR